jgi:hypothetical protein
VLDLSEDDEAPMSPDEALKMLGGAPKSPTPRPVRNAAKDLEDGVTLFDTEQMGTGEFEVRDPTKVTIARAGGNTVMETPALDDSQLDVETAFDADLAAAKKKEGGITLLDTTTLKALPQEGPDGRSGSSGNTRMLDPADIDPTDILDAEPMEAEPLAPEPEPAAAPQPKRSSSQMLRRKFPPK